MIKPNKIKSNLSNKIFIITGSLGEGKTTQIQKIVEILKNQNISTGGILSPRIVENGTTIGYDIVDIRTNEREAFLRKTGDEKLPKIGSYSILPGGIKKGRKALKNSQNTNQVVVLDEVGRLELNNKGWTENIKSLLNGPKCNLILSVRDKFMEEVIEKWYLKDYTILHVSDNDYITNSNIIARQIN